MTIAISLKVHDGLVLAADSASTIMGINDQGEQTILNVYNNANKIFNLYKGLPIGGITWGAGSIGHASISTLAKDLRKRFHGEDARHKDWKINPISYSIKELAEKTRGFLFDEHYYHEFHEKEQKPSLGFIVAGYSAGEDLAEEWKIQIDQGNCPEPQQIREKSECGITWGGEPEVVSRLILGYGTNLPKALEELGVPMDQIQPAILTIQKKLNIPLVVAPMPIQDAIDLAEYVVEATIKFSRFNLSAPTVGGPIEIAAVTKHEGFKWVRRKHYYSEEFNKERK